MDPTETERRQLKNVLSQFVERVSTCLHFNMADGVHPVLQQRRRSTNMARATTAKMMVKEVHGQTMFTSLKVGLNLQLYTKKRNKLSVD